MNTTNIYNLPSSLVDALTKNTYDLARTSNILSATTLIDSPKIAHLKHRHWKDLEEDVSDRIWLLLGSSIHAILENVDDKNRFIEERFYADTETWELVDKKDIKEDKFYIAGKPDLYEIKEKTIFDYKITSCWSVMYGKKEWETQLNLYAWFYRKLGMEVKKLHIVAILKDWSKKNKLTYGKDYPEIQVAVVDIPLWTFEEQQKYIEERFKLHFNYRKSLDDEIPECTEKERWKQPDVFAVMKNDNKRADKLFEVGSEAQAYAESLSIAKDKYTVVQRPGQDRRCLDYCAVKDYCHYYKKTYQDKKD